MKKNESIQLKYKGTALLKENKILSEFSKLNKYIDFLKKEVSNDADYKFPESSINLSVDTNLIEAVENIASRKAERDLKFIIVVGIGGSNLGTMAVQEALFGTLDDKMPTILFADTVSPKKLQQIMHFIDEEIADETEIILNIVTKSGGTTETIANFNVLYSYLKNKFSNIEERIVITTDHGSRLWSFAEEHNINKLFVPKLVGGRYSVLSAVGLFPLLSVGIDIHQLLQGAKKMRSVCISNDITENIAVQSAILQYLHYKNGKIINNNFFFNTELESLGKWYRQLMGESIGKKNDVNGNEVHAGITPIVSIGSTDLHSMAQLYLGGANDKFTNFVYVPNEENPVSVSSKPFADLVDGIAGKTYDQLMSAIYNGVLTAYKNNELPYMEVVLPDINAFSVGQYLQFKMLEMMYLGKLFNINTFDQPNVEDYKKVTRELLKGK